MNKFFSFFKMIGVYYESWNDWKNGSYDDTDIFKNIPDNVTHVYLSFVKPDCKYKLGDYKWGLNWGSTGLSLTNNFNTVKKSIEKLQQKGKKVFLSVGGATYSWRIYNVVDILNLMKDLNCDGIDIDWEPTAGIQLQDQLVQIIKDFADKMLSNEGLSIAGLAYGCNEPDPGNPFSGANIKAMQQVGNLIDHVNVMTYDGGKDLNVKKCIEQWKKFHNNIIVGLEVGPQGWGDGLLKLSDVDEYFKFSKDFFIWAFFKDGNPNCYEVLDRLKSLGESDQPPVVVKPVPVPNPCSCNCPKCGYKLTIK
jgi:hypothetical protein